MKNCSLFLIIIALICPLENLAQIPAGSDKPADWTRDDPFSIAYEVRKAEFEKGNLVPNPSFEKGLEGWAIKGQGSRVSICEKSASDGKKSLRISRLTINEHAPADGVESGFIPVIEANYLFTFRLKAEDVWGTGWRTGQKMGSDITVRVECYDKDKKLLNSAIVAPMAGIVLDNSDKSLSFKNFWHIDSLGWSFVVGRSDNYPTSTGDVSEDTRYVKIFFGLKGMGTIWVDDVDFRLSKWNFSALERMKPYIEKEYTLPELLIPMPQEITNTERIHYMSGDYGNTAPAILIPADAAKQTRTGAELVKRKLEAAMQAQGLEGGVAMSARLSDLPDDALIISIGKTSVFVKNKAKLSLKQIADKEQGYIMDKRGRFLVLAGNQPIGDYYAATTLAQLFEQDVPVIHFAQVVDYPDFLGRSCTFRGLENDPDFYHKLSEMKMNMPICEWHIIHELTEIHEKEGTLKLGIRYHPYNTQFLFEMNVANISDSIAHVYTHSNPVHVDTVKARIARAIEAGGSFIQFMSDDYIPHTGNNKKYYTLYNEEDYNEFTSLQHAQAHALNEIWDMLQEDYPEVGLEFCPPWYWNEAIQISYGKAESYFRDLDRLLPKEVKIIWTGPTVRSLIIDDVDIHYQKKKIGRTPKLWDNTPYARAHTNDGYRHYPGKVKMCSLFEGMDIIVPEGFELDNDGREIYTNGYRIEENYYVKALTYADFMWNMDDYDPELSSWKALLKMYGRDMALDLLAWSEKYFQLVDMGVSTNAARIYGVPTKPYIEKGHLYKKELADMLDELEDKYPGYDKLYGELREDVWIETRRFENYAYDNRGVIEGESIKLTENTGGKASDFDGHRNRMSDLSGGRFLHWNSGGTKGNSISFEVEVKQAGKYRMDAAPIYYSDGGSFQFYVDGEKTGKALDTYMEEAPYWGRRNVEIGSLKLKAGSHKVRIEFTGAGKGGSELSLDFIKFVKQ